eukprot:9601007-Lingulodinium_polyedra.AAC.1
MEPGSSWQHAPSAKPLQQLQFPTPSSWSSERYQHKLGTWKQEKEAIKQQARCRSKKQIVYTY